MTRWLGGAGEPGSLVVPAGAGLVAAPPGRPVLGVPGRAVAGRRGEQAGDLRDGQRNHPGVGGWGLVWPSWRRCLGIGAVAQRASVTAQMASTAMTSMVWRAIAW